MTEPIDWADSLMDELSVRVTALKKSITYVRRKSVRIVW